MSEFKSRIEAAASYNKFSEVEKLLAEAAAQEALSVDMLFQGVLARVGLKDFEGGIEQFKKIKERIDKNAEDKATWTRNQAWLLGRFMDLTIEDFNTHLRAAKIILEFGFNLERAYKILAIDAVDKGDFPRAEELLKKALSLNPKYATGWYNLACVYAKGKKKVEMLSALKNAIEYGRSEYVTDYRPQIEEEQDFVEYRTDPEFQELISRLPKDPVLREVYQALADDSVDSVLVRGQKALSKAEDQIAVYDAMNEAIRRILSDMDEHEMHRQDYYAQSMAHYQKLEEEFNRELKTLKARGLESDVFRVFEG